MEKYRIGKVYISRTTPKNVAVVNTYAYKRCITPHTTEP